MIGTYFVLFLGLGFFALIFKDLRVPPKDTRALWHACRWVEWIDTTTTPFANPVWKECPKKGWKD